METENWVLVGWTLRWRSHLPPTLCTIRPGGRVIAYSTLLQIIGVRTNFFLCLCPGFLQARDLPSRGVLPFVQGLLCNTGSSCRNISFESSMDHHFRYEKHKRSFQNSQDGFICCPPPPPQIPQLLQHHEIFMHAYNLGRVRDNGRLEFRVNNKPVLVLGVT